MHLRRYPCSTGCQEVVGRTWPGTQKLNPCAVDEWAEPASWTQSNSEYADLGREEMWVVAAELKAVRKMRCWADDLSAAQERVGDGPFAGVEPVSDVVAPRTHATVGHRH